MDATAVAILVAVVVLIALGIGAWIFMRYQKSRKLQRRFGPEYETALREHGDRNKAERVLERRTERVERYRIRPLTDSERDRFTGEWRHTQARFVDDPAGSIGQADDLVCRVMEARGYPMLDFEQRAEDLSVDHPRVVNNYRQAHEIAVRHEQGRASTEDLRKAMVCYRELFEDLLEVQVVGGEVRK